MNKKILIAATAALLSASAFAAEGMYIKAGVGAHRPNKISDKHFNQKMKPATKPAMEVAIGYKVADAVSAELSLEHMFSPKFSKSNVDGKLSSTGTPAYTKGKVTHKVRASALFVKGYFDVTDMNGAKVFVGGGVGLARLNDKINYNYTDATPAAQSKTDKSKNRTNFALKAEAGVGFEAAPGVELRVAYGYGMYGKTKSSAEFKKSIKLNVQEIKANVLVAL